VEIGIRIDHGFPLTSSRIEEQDRGGPLAHQRDPGMDLQRGGKSMDTGFYYHPFAVGGYCRIQCFLNGQKTPANDCANKIAYSAAFLGLINKVHVPISVPFHLFLASSI